METVTITRLQETKRGRYSLFSDEGFLFSVDVETLYAYQIKEGSSLSGEELLCVKARSDTRKAKDKALEYLSLRDHASGELYDKLVRKFDPDSADAAVKAMFDLDLLDDERFARHRAKYLIGQKKSLMQVRQKLSALGISREIIYTIIEELQEQEHSEQDTLVQLIEKSYLRKLQSGQTEKVTAALMRRGFSYRDVKAALEEFDYEDDEQEWM